MKQIGNLFILRININLVGSILDSPVRPDARITTKLSKSCSSDRDIGVLLVFPRSGTAVQCRTIIFGDLTAYRSAQCSG